MEIRELKRLFSNSFKTCVLYRYDSDETNVLYQGEIWAIPDEFDSCLFEMYDSNTLSQIDDFEIEIE